MRADDVIWVGEPSKPYDKRFNHWPKWTVWPYKMKFDGVECETTFLMGVEEYEIYLAEKELLDYLNKFRVGGIQFNWQKKRLIKLIDKYGDTREQKGRSDVQEDWAESEAGASW